MSDSELGIESESDSDNESIDMDDFYETEEVSLTKFNIVVCERYNPIFHGISSEEMNYHYLVHMRIKNNNFNYIQYIFNNLSRSKFEIAECFYLPSQYCICILKTFWLKIIQKKWKNILRDRKNIIRKRCNHNSLKYREINGKWPLDCIYYPGLKGMLSNLSKTSF